MPPKTETKKPETKTAPKVEKKEAPKKEAPKVEKKESKKEAPKKVEKVEVAPKKEATPKVEAAPKKDAPKKKPKKDDSKHKFVVNTEKIEQLKKATKEVRTGGKGSVRRTHKVSRVSSGADDAKLQAVLKKQNIRPIECEGVNFIMDDESVIQFSKPKLQASVQANTFVVSGKYEKKSYQDALPGMLGGMDLSKLASTGDDDIPELESFEQK
jgi:nascent polypeptide-associated complex subunit beta